MKANEFVKKFGLDYAIKFINHNASIAEDRCILDFGEYYYLRRLVESHEWIGLCGGLEDARALAVVHNDAALLESIADVESCMEAQG